VAQASRAERAKDGGERAVLGWREWVALPELGVPRIKCKIDTGARTSALHTFRVERFRERGRERVRFWIHPLQRRVDVEVACVADLVDERVVTDSGGHRERRLVVETALEIGAHRFPIELTLTRRDTMRFRMLLGRTALFARFVIDPARSYLTGRPLRAVRRPAGAAVRQSLRGDLQE
jgi:hypothetical protein